MISLQNKGLLELDLITIMGVSVKRGDSIGFFGTGLKYAIAVFLREGVEFSMHIGANKFTFHTEPQIICGKEFQCCYMSGPYDTIKLPFTTEFGKTWEVWQAYREIHSNCLDEENSIISQDHLDPTEDTTTFYVEDLGFDGTFLNQEDKPLYENKEIQIFEGESEYLYYKGIRAKDIRKSKYTYNVLKKCQLTEDRLLSYDWQVKETINAAVVKMAETAPEVMAEIISSKDEWFEGDLSMSYHTEIEPTEAFVEAVKEVKDVNYSVTQYVKKHEPPKPLTWLQRRANFVDELQSLCDEYDVHDCGVTCSCIELEGGILNDEPKE